jgi:aspartate oxidase
LVNADGVQFVMPLEPRDVVAAAIIRECTERHHGIDTPTGQVGVWLDSPMIDLRRGAGTVARELPAMVRQFGRYGIDIAKEPMLIYPTLHYQNGGIKINADGATTIPGLFAAGECEGGVHGRNRLIGNSTLDIFVFGRRAGRAAAQWSKQAKPGAPTLNHVRHWQKSLNESGLARQRPISPMLLPDYAKAIPDYLPNYARESLKPSWMKLA